MSWHHPELATCGTHHGTLKGGAMDGCLIPDSRDSLGLWWTKVLLFPEGFNRVFVSSFPGAKTVIRSTPGEVRVFCSFIFLSTMIGRVGKEIDVVFSGSYCRHFMHLHGKIYVPSLWQVHVPHQRIVAFKVFMLFLLPHPISPMINHFWWSEHLD